MRAYWKLAIGVTAALAVGLGLLFGFPVEPVRGAAAIGGRLELAAGDVRVSQGGERTTTVSGMPLEDKADITTGHGARALVRLVGGASAFVGDDTVIRISGSGVTLTNGRVWLDVPKLSQPAMHELGLASVAVSDAGLSIERGKDRVSIYAARGLAVVSCKHGRREIAAGERASVNAAGDIEVEAVAFWEDWTGGMADRGLDASQAGTGSGLLYAVDRDAPAGTPVEPLSIQRQTVRARIADGVAETEVDQTFFNAGERIVEGYYWFTVPERALVTGFALETNGQLVEGEVVERKEAAAKYQAAIQNSNDPALLEWINDRTYRARIYPIGALATRRVVLRYVEPVSLGEGRIRWVYPMAGAKGESTTIDEFSLAVDLGELGKTATLSTLPDARIEQGGRFVTMRRSVYTPRADFQVEVTPKRTAKSLRIARFDAKGDRADFVMLRWVPDLDWSTERAPNAELVLSVDISAGGDESDRALKLAVTEAVLRNLAAGDKFALMTTDVKPRVIYPENGLASADAEHVSAALERLSAASIGGATDLGAMFDPGLSRLHAAEQPALVYIGDGLATSGELRGAEVVERLRRSLEGARARFFAVGIGAEANHPLLERLAAVGGGGYFRVDSDELAVREALRLTAYVKTPTITDLTVDVGVGLDEPLSNVSGKLARGEELTLLARTHHELPRRATIQGRLFGRAFKREYDISLDHGSATALVPRFWAAEFARRLLGRAKSPDEARGKIVGLALEYGLVTPFSSILALDSEASYQHMGIPRRNRPWDRLNVEQASVGSPSPAEDTLAMVLAPLTLLTGCSSDKAVPHEESAAVRTIATSAPVQPPPQAAADATSAARVMEQTEPLAAPVNYDGREDDGRAMEESSKAGLGTRMANRPRRSSRQRGGYDPASDPSVGRGQVVEPRASAYVATRVCSDVAARPLADRSVLWQRRLRSAHNMNEALALYDDARAACEIGGQRDQRILLALIEPFASNAEGAEILFGHFAHDAQAVQLLARRVLRRSLDPYVTAVARRQSNHGSIDWLREDLALAALPSDETRVERLRALLLGAPADMEGELRLMKFMLRAGKRNEALSMATRLRERGPLSPLLLRDLGDIQLEAGLADDALRTYTEIVEFDPENAKARAMVGDTLLAHGWYDVAYRQFRTLVELTQGSPSSQIRLALAASGSGRTDEALRILRAVAEGDAEPGPNDLRGAARMLAGAMFARLLADASQDPARIQLLGRQLKQLQLLPAAGALYLLTWEHLDVALGLGSVSGDVTDGSSVGVLALTSPEQALEALSLGVTLRSERTSKARVHYRLHELVFDGKVFRVKVLPGDLG